MPFRVAGKRVGRVRPAFAAHLRQWPDVFQVSDERIDLSASFCDFESRTEAVENVVKMLVEQHIIPRTHGEMYPVAPSGRDKSLLLLDRGAAHHFGIQTYGQHVNGFVKAGAEIKMWLGRRSADRRGYPLKLDNMAAGGLPYDIDLADNLAKECWEEAGVPRALADQARSVGLITYRQETENGFKPDTLFCYDLEVPEDFAPRCTDGEVEEFYCWPLNKVAEIVENSNEFKPNCNLVIIDFLVRHGFIEPEHPDYLALVQGLHESAD